MSKRQDDIGSISLVNQRSLIAIWLSEVFSRKVGLNEAEVWEEVGIDQVHHGVAIPVASAFATLTEFPRRTSLWSSTSDNSVIPNGFEQHFQVLRWIGPLGSKLVQIKGWNAGEQYGLDGRNIRSNSTKAAGY